ncbi:filamentous hemagglutinin N-terminal domain-containing protein [Calothrix sp. FACHB-1219]|uniref:two-partner secretion domain-containing protein n=1 Tax=unclassified Calothrix TaxID=2619626 RepID=UPI0016861BCB|nr:MULTISPECIES: filamentous hemagglutinin N-terminal domain-containing protein [unclassified Calothrix]MBD2203118.1 filamentous hemagglutinin N-terminal domain-containing protein [Calothrix sp. FACHB-168]MBD2218719.1 filamentous hemagglutinin N-terminal domain-containing protein [Calothrix sp. FACHB-1219]
MVAFTSHQLWQLFAITSLICALMNSAQAQIVPDNTLGAESTNLTTNTNVQGLPTTLIEGGATRGVNLFQSFLQFNIGEGQRVYFANPAGIENIFTRVTGSDTSKIFGTLGVDGRANLYFLNPNGIIFGANARLDIPGSFLATTANSFVFNNGLKFSANNPEAAPLLTVNLRPGLQFAENQSASISNRGNLNVGQELSLIAGNLDLQGQLIANSLTGNSGNITLISQQGGIDSKFLNITSVADNGLAGNVTITAPGDIYIGNIKLASNSSNNHFSKININSTNGSVYLTGSNFNIQNIGSGYAGEIAINARKLLQIDNASKVFITGNLGKISLGVSEYPELSPEKININNSQINNSNFEAGYNVGDITMKSLGELLIDNSNLETVTASSSYGGKINLEANTISLANQSSLFANTLSTGKAGSINLQTTGGAVSLSASSINTGSNQLNVNLENLTNQEGAGGGDINIAASDLFLTNISLLNASTLGSGDSGSISITVDKTASFSDNSILNARTYLRGNAGNVNITSQDLIFNNESLIQATTFGTGNAGNINIIAPSLTLSNTSRIDAQTFGSGNAGNININTQLLSLQGGARINAETFASGNGGNITINPLNDASQATAAINISGSAPLIRTSSGFSVNTESEKNDAGSGGNITITTGTLSINNGGVLSAPSKSRARGGNININVHNLELTGGGQIITNAYRSGQAGSIKINATENITISGQNYEYEQKLNELKQQLDFLKAVYDVLLVENDKDSQRILNPINNLVNKLSDFLANPKSILFLNELKTRLDKFKNSFDFQLIISDPEIASLLVPINNLINNLDRLEQIINYVPQINALQERLNKLKYTYDFVVPTSDGEVRRILGPINQYSGLFANTEANSTGDGGTINIDPIQVTLKDEAKISVDSQGTGVAGSISISANRLTLDNLAGISADTDSGQGGSITLNVQDLLLLRRHSTISTTAGKQGAGGDGGAIAINLNPNNGFIVSPAAENNDISANAFSGSGGAIEINAKGVIGLATLTRLELEQKLGTTNPEKLDPQLLQTNDITAISQTDPQLNGVVSINSPEIDPSKSIISLPTNATDPSQQIAQSCGVGNQKLASTFTDAGRGGLPSKPDEFLSSDTVWEDVRLRANSPQQTVSTEAVKPTASQEKTVLTMPATGWLFNNKGEVTLISHTPQSSTVGIDSSTCAVK